MGTGLVVDEPDRDRDAEEIERGEPAVLPEREAMSILTSAGGDTQAASGEERVSSEDRGEHSESRDSG
jgi:hypothetical protein